MAESVKVIVRCRPMNERERLLKCKCCLKFDEKINKASIFKVGDKSNPAKNFTFDGAYFTDSTTKQIYEDVGFSLVDGVLEGYNGTVFAYGQTGCGKSFSMQGITHPPEQKGIIPRSFEHIFEAIDVDEGDTKFLVQASYLEIYNEEIRDLLGKDIKQRLELRESPDSGVYTQGLSQHNVKSMGECMKMMEKGWNNRATGATLMNADSSRSHSIFAVRIEMITADEEVGEDAEDKIKVGKLNLVDLAGSERQGKTGATGDRLREATKINLSLSALGNVISALVDGKSKHIPYRDSKLTRLLQDSLGGNTKTMMVACVSPADNNYEETLSTLRYANRAKNIKNKPKINEDPKDALLREYAEEIKRLKEMLDGKIPVALQPVAPVNQVTSSESIEDRPRSDSLRREYEDQIAELNMKYEEERISREKLNEELQSLREEYNSRVGDPVTDEGGTENKKADSEEKLEIDNRRDTHDMAVSPMNIGEMTDVGESRGEGVCMGTSPLGWDTNSLEVESVTSSIPTPLPVISTTPAPPATQYSIQLTLQQAETLTTKQLSNLVLTPTQQRILGYDGPITPAHISCLTLGATQIAHLDLTAEQRAELSPRQESVVTELSEQCEQLAYDQLLSYVQLLKSTGRLQLTHQQAQTLSSEQLGAVVLGKEQSKEFGGVTTAQELTLEQLTKLELTPAQVAQIRLTDEQIASLEDSQYEIAVRVGKLLEKNELMCLLSDSKLQDIPTVTLTSAQATELEAGLVETLPLTDTQVKIIKEYKETSTGTAEVGDVDQLPLLPHQVKHLKIEETCTLSKEQSEKVGQSMATQTYVENVAIATMVDIEEGLTKTVTLSPAESATITQQQIANIQVAVSEKRGEWTQGSAEPLTLTPIEIHQMKLTEEQVAAIKAKKLKRIEKHGKIVKKLGKQSAAVLELGTESATPEPHLVLTAKQAAQVEGGVIPTKNQQENLNIEPGRVLRNEDLGEVVLTPSQIAQIDVSPTILQPEQIEACTVAKQQLIKQDALKRLKENMPLEEVQLELSQNQLKNLTPKQLSSLQLTSEQCEVLGLAPGQSLTLNHVSLISLNGDQILQLKLSPSQLSELETSQKQIVASAHARGLNELAYLHTTENETVLTLSEDQTEILSEEQLAKLNLSPAQYKQLGLDSGEVITRYDVSRIELTSVQLHSLNLTDSQVSYLSEEQQCLLQEALESVTRSETIEKALRFAGVLPCAASKGADKVAETKKEKENGHEEEIKTKLIRLTAEQAGLLTQEQLSTLTLNPVQMEQLDITVEEIPYLTPSQIAELQFTQKQIASLNISNFQLKGMRSKVGSSENRKRNMPRVQEMPMAEAATEISESDKTEAIKLHKEALEKLQLLKESMVQGGADLQVQTSKKEIREKLKKRRERAEQRKRKLRAALQGGDDDGVIQELFNMQMDQVEMRDKKLAKIKEKFEEKSQEVSDLATEFQTEREDYLESIREQGQEAKLLQQILEQVQPLLRRDSNYYNLDAIKRDSKWDPESGNWLIPPVMINKTSLPASQSTSSTKDEGRLQPSFMDCPDDLRLRAKLSTTSDNTSYFRSSRQERLLQEKDMLNSLHFGNGNLSNGHTSATGKKRLNPLQKPKKSRHRM